MTLLNVYNCWVDAGMCEDWAKVHFLNQKELERAYEIRSQLEALMDLHEVPIISCGGRYEMTGT